MDLTLNEQQQEIADLAGRILGEQCPPALLRELERDGPGAGRMAGDAWAALARADLLGVALPEADGGAGLGLLEAGQVARQVGRHVALVPYWTSTAAALAISRWGSREQRRDLLPGAVDGTGPLAVAWWEPVATGTPEMPGLTATPDGDGYRLDGVKGPVPWASTARALVVPAALRDPHAGRRAVFLVDPDASGLTTTGERPITGEPAASLRFEQVRVGPGAVLGTPDRGDEVARSLERHLTALLVTTMLGICEEALAITGRHVSEREQFGVPIGTFQAVAHRCADAYIDTEAVRLTALQALWQLDQGFDGDGALRVATLWACEGGQRVVHAAQHLHGGIGVDIDYPIHRYFRWAKVVELLLGGANRALTEMSTSLAAAGDDTDDARDVPARRNRPET